MCYHSLAVLPQHVRLDTLCLLLPAHPTWQAGGAAVGLCGKDSDIIRARQMVEKDIGFVGEVTSVNPSLLKVGEVAKDITHCQHKSGSPRARTAANTGHTEAVMSAKYAACRPSWLLKRCCLPARTPAADAGG